MSYIIERSLSLKFSNVFHAWTSAFDAVEQPLIGNSKSLRASISDHFCATGCRISSKHKPCLKSHGRKLQIQTAAGLHRRASLHQRVNALGLEQRFVEEQTDRERLRRYLPGDDGKPLTISEPGTSLQTNFAR
ncbi:hypothetical protein LOY24_00670 [Pseudomonas putida]|jgi:hypothetical protein|uniref:hypothetical protein n=1 Tax=Pseudomonas putida TaxID=303 RepID=UPI00215F82D0|nr:hypothetical protein [Pseudomonas putida]UVL78690.1 hypothetical protein LOY24_00670 [Pseudomonas putida]